MVRPQGRLGNRAAFLLGATGATATAGEWARSHPAGVGEGAPVRVEVAQLGTRLASRAAAIEIG